MKERKEVEEVKDAEKKNGGVAAFFDLDGTLMPMPSLENVEILESDPREKLFFMADGSAAAYAARDQRDPAGEQNVFARCAYF